MRNVPCNLGGCVDRTLCPYKGYFPKIECILRKCNTCGTAKFHREILNENKDKTEDERQCFLVKLWYTKREKKKDGTTQSFLHWKFERCNYNDLARLLIEHLETMAEYSFNASWNYSQYKIAKRNIRKGDLIFVHDFSQNYLCSHQNECQGLHWKHAQVTMMPTVAHYICPRKDCNSLVTHFTTLAIDVIRKNGIKIHKIVQFTDQAPSQYKNKTAFRYLTQYKVPRVQNIFGARHGKSSCDACTGRVKQGVSRLVHSGTEVVNSAGTLFTTCVKHLQKLLTKQSEECQHHILTFHLHETLKSRPHTISWPGVPNTHKFHSIGNTNTKDVYLRNFICCCVGCLHGDEPCPNDVCPDKWQGYSFKRNKFVEPNLDFWFHDREPDLHTLHVENVDWATRINEMSSI